MSTLNNVFVATFLLISISGLRNTVEGSESISLNTCADRSSLKLVDFKEFHGRNGDCKLDCITNQGMVLSYNIREGESCFRERGDKFRCSLGKCLVSTEAEDSSSKDLMLPQIRILSAYVPDMDPYPAQGESDVFVSVHIEKEGEPSYANGDFLCYTHVIQDNSRPRWRNFLCKPSAMKQDTVLKFTVIDSDKPAVSPDILGQYTVTLSKIANQGPTKLYFSTDRANPASQYFVEVDVRASKYEVPMI